VPLPTLIVTGASGFVGRHLLDEIKGEYRIFAIARRSQRECGAPVHPNIAWMQVDIGDRDSLTRTFREVQAAGGAQLLLHLAAYYDFAGENQPEYVRTNVGGARNVFDLARELKPQRVIFASSVAACGFPRPEGPVSESTPPDGHHIYAWSKRQGEEMLREYEDAFPCTIVRFGAVFSDWCEYPPLYMFIDTWLGRSWKARILAGRGTSAIPYIHVRDVVAFLLAVLDNSATMDRREVLVGSTSGCTSHLELFRLAHQHFSGAERGALFMPKTMCGAGMLGMEALGRVTGRMPFERLWMLRYIDRQLAIDNSRTCARLGWSPSPRFRIERRMAFLIERLRSQPFEWQARNAAAMRRTPARPDLRILNALVKVEDLVVASVLDTLADERNAARFPTYRLLDREELAWRVRLYYRLLLSSLRSSDRMVIANYMEVTAPTRFRGGFTGEEVTALLDALNGTILHNLELRPEIREASHELHHRITVPIEFAKDEVLDQYDKFIAGPVPEEGRAEPPVEEVPASPKQALEETIWNILVHRQ
jgi:nucleoside-diphosphate-sugar epimerase